MNKALLICLAFFISSCGSMFMSPNPYWKGEIRLTDGTVKNGYIMVPHTSRERKIAFKPSMTGEKEMVQRNLIETVRVVSENGRKYLYENLTKVKGLKGKASRKKSLLLAVAKNDYSTFYIESEFYKVNEKTREISTIDNYVQGRDLPMWSYYIRKRGNLEASLFSVTGQGMWIGLNSKLKKLSKVHLIEDEDLVQKIDEGDLKHRDTPEIIRLYLETTKGM